MKKTLLPLLLLFIGQVSIAQEFMFQLNFTDAVGNKDSLLIGYDINATDTVDAGFGEINIISTPLDTAFDVRISSVYYTVSGWPQTSSNFQLKKQITKQNSTCDFSIITIDIFAKNWPITATWNNVFFNDTCLEGSVFTSVHPGGWWDVGSTSNLYLRELAIFDSVTFSSNNSGNLFLPGYTYDGGAYLNANNDTLSVFWLKLGDSSILNTAVNQLVLDNKIIIYPNPTKDVITIQINETTFTKSRFKLIDVIGKEVVNKKITSNTTSIDVSQYTKGVYFYQILHQKELISGKLIIQ